MMKLYTFLLCLSPIIGNAQTINFPDDNFKNALLAANSANNYAKNLQGDYFKIDADNNGEIEQIEADQVSELMLAGQSISDFDGIAHFTNLVQLDCTANGLPFGDLSGNGAISLDISGTPNLKRLICPLNTLASGIQSFTNLEELDLYSCVGLGGTLDFTAFTNLKTLNLNRTQTISLNVNGLSALENLNISYNPIEAIDLASLINLKSLDNSWTNISSIDVANHTNLELIHSIHSPLAILNVSGCSNLKKINCRYTHLGSLDASNLTQLEELLVMSQNLTSLNVSGDTSLRILTAEFCSLTELDAGNLPNLERLNVEVNQLASLNITGSNNLTRVWCPFNQLTSLDCSGLSQLTSVLCGGNPLQTLYVKNGIDEIELSISPNDQLQHICADQSQIDAIVATIANDPLINQNCIVDSSCDLLATQSFDQNIRINVFPNPVQNVLSIESDQTMTISQIVIYDMLGQQILSPNRADTIDVSRLSAGTYILKLVSNQGTVAKHFIKK